MKILVLDGNQNQAVAAVRSLARAGHTVLVGDSSSWSKAGWSRFSHGSFRYPGPQKDIPAFVHRITELAAAEPGTLVLPMSEATTLPISAHRDILECAGARLILPAHADVLRAFDKNETTRLAESLGITVPKTVLVSTMEEAEKAALRISYPLVLKPRASEEVSATGAVRATGRPQYAGNLEELRTAYRDMSGRASAILLQQYVEGTGTGYFALMRNGDLRAEFAHLRIRDVRPTGSGSAVRVSIKPPPEIREASLAILRDLRWHGVAMVEFRQPDGGSPVFMEVNGRFWHSLALACYAGSDFPALMAKMAENGDVEPLLDYATGVRCRWLLGDFRHLVEVWRGAPAGYPGKYPGRLQTLGAVVRPVPGTVHDLFSWNDPLPELGDWLYFVRRMTRRR